MFLSGKLIAEHGGGWIAPFARSGSIAQPIHCGSVTKLSSARKVETPASRAWFNA